MEMDTAQRNANTRPRLTKRDMEMAKIAERVLMASLDHSRAASIVLTTESGEKPSVDVPPQALRLIGELLRALSEGQAVAVIPENRELTTIEAAHYLNVSRPFVIKEIDNGRLPCRKVGTHRRILFSDLLAYKTSMNSSRREALNRMAENAHELGLDY